MYVSWLQIVKTFSADLIILLIIKNAGCICLKHLSWVYTYWKLNEIMEAISFLWWESNYRSQQVFYSTLHTWTHLTQVWNHNSTSTTEETGMYVAARTRPTDERWSKINERFSINQQITVCLKIPGVPNAHQINRTNENCFIPANASFVLYGFFKAPLQQLKREHAVTQLHGWLTIIFLLSFITRAICPA